MDLKANLTIIHIFPSGYKGLNSTAIQNAHGAMDSAIIASVAVSRVIPGAAKNPFPERDPSPAAQDGNARATNIIFPTETLPSFAAYAKLFARHVRFAVVVQFEINVCMEHGIASLTLAMTVICHCEAIKDGRGNLKLMHHPPVLRGYLTWAA